MSTSRISIDVTPEEHKRLKALAALQGQSIKDFVLDRTLRDTPQDEEKAVSELVDFLDSRFDRAKKEGVSKRTVHEVFEEAYRESNSNGQKRFGFLFGVKNTVRPEFRSRGSNLESRIPSTSSGQVACTIARIRRRRELPPPLKLRRDKLARHDDPVAAIDLDIHRKTA